MQTEVRIVWVGRAQRGRPSLIIIGLKEKDVPKVVPQQGVKFKICNWE